MIESYFNDVTQFRFCNKIGQCFLCLEGHFARAVGSYFGSIAEAWCFYFTFKTETLKHKNTRRNGAKDHNYERTSIKLAINNKFEGLKSSSGFIGER